MPGPAVDVDFENTEIAFRSKSDASLRRAQLLFSAFGSPTLVTAGPKLVGLAFAMRLPVTPIIRATIYKQFVGGETIEGCEGAVAGLAEFGIGSILDYSVEALDSEEDFDRTRDEVMRVIELAAKDRRVPFAVFKVTGIARFDLLEKIQSGAALTTEERAEETRARARFDALCAAAAARKVRILVDAEESWVQDPMDAWTLAAMSAHNKGAAYVFNTAQMYRHDRLAFVKKVLAQGKKDGFVPGLKLVRGAYMEKERARAEARGEKSPIHPDKGATDKAFDAGLRLMVDAIVAGSAELMCGSHNEPSNRLLIDLLRTGGLAPKDRRVTFAQLLGMSDNLSYNLADAGFNVAKYVPYGPVRAVMPYLFRRAAENTSIKGQAGRELTLIEAELKRRRRKAH